MALRTVGQEAWEELVVGCERPAVQRVGFEAPGRRAGGDFLGKFYLRQEQQRVHPVPLVFRKEFSYTVRKEFLYTNTVVKNSIATQFFYM